MLVPAEKSVKLQLEKRLEEERIKEERMHDVLLLLDNLVQREEATVKIILDCLYDVGSINIINQKVGFRPMNRFLKAIARLTKPAFRAVAWRWFKGNCPQLITEWLRTKVTF
jgi:GGDEF domain-containing protein